MMKRLSRVVAVFLAPGMLCALGIARIGGSAAGLSFPLGQRPPVSLVPDLAIGVEDGDENLIFGSISRIDLDGKGSIYILDYKYRAIRIFDGNGRFIRSIPVPAGQGPQEATNLSGIAVTPQGTLFINDTRKVIVYGPDGKYLRTFLVDFMISSIGCAGTEDLIAIGPHLGKILHVFDPTGRLLESWGDPFPVPKEFEAMKEMPMFQAPLLFNCAKDGHVFVLNPHQYEIFVFKDRRLEEVLKGKSELFRPVEQKGRGFVSTAADIVRSGDLTFVVLSNPGQKKADVFEAGTQIGTIDVSGRPFCVDSRGRVYFTEVEGFPRVVRYSVRRE